jgi:hypothetical protein
METDELRKEET